MSENITFKQNIAFALGLTLETVERVESMLRANALRQECEARYHDAGKPCIAPRLFPIRYQTYDDACADRNPIKQGDRNYASAIWEKCYIAHPKVFQSEIKG